MFHAASPSTRSPSMPGQVIAAAVSCAFGAQLKRSKTEHPKPWIPNSVSAAGSLLELFCGDVKVPGVPTTSILGL